MTQGRSFRRVVPVLALALLASACSTTRARRSADLVPLPAPTGPQPVGTEFLDLTIAGRPDPFAPGTERRILVQLYYPAAASRRCALDAYMDAPTAEAATQDGPLPPGFAARVTTHSCVGALLARGASRLPVILFSHGLGASRFGYRALLEDLASRGYVVAAIQHTYGSAMTAFPDGTRAAWKEEPWASMSDVERNLDEWVKDAQFVITHLAEMNTMPKSRFANRLDLARLGYAGHSYGGASAIVTATRDDRVRAACNLDGRLFDSVKTPVRLAVPLLVLLNESSPRRDQFATGENVILAQIRGATHTTFSDTPLLDAAFQVPDELAAKLSHPIRPEEGLALTRESVAGFFDCTLRGEAARCDEVRERLAGTALLKENN